MKDLTQLVQNRFLEKDPLGWKYHIIHVVKYAKKLAKK